MSVSIYKSPKFKTFIKGLLTRCGCGEMVNKICKAKIQNHTGLELYSIGLTHKSINELYNYEYYEWMGDSTANNCVCWYLTKRFPILKQPKAVKILARLKINLGSKKTFYQLSEKLGFWDFITAGKEQIKKNGEYITIDVRQHKKKDLLEDALESFIGITQTILDQEFGMGVGFTHCYKFIESLYDELDISLAYKDLYDAKTRLKEMFDEWTTEESALRWWKEGYGSHKNLTLPQEHVLQDRSEDRPLGNKKWSKQNIRATYITEDNGRELEFGYWKVEVVYKGVEDICDKNRKAKEIIIGRGTGPKKDQAEQIACENAITYLNKDRKIITNRGSYICKGLFKTIDPIYKEINDGPVKTKNTIDLTSLKKPELVQICKKHKIKGYSTKKKADIIILIQSYKIENL